MNQTLTERKSHDEFLGAITAEHFVHQKPTNMIHKGVRHMSIELKVKAKSLADEARTIRIEEKRAKAKRQTSTVNSLHHHRTQIVRPAARATHIARAFLAGASYRSVERTTRTEPPLNEAAQMLVRYGGLESKLDAKTALNFWIEASR